jgi:hypothetical protein
MTIPDLKTGRAITHCTSHSIPFLRYLEIHALGANLETMIHDKAVQYMATNPENWNFSPHDCIDQLRHR